MSPPDGDQDNAVHVLIIERYGGRVWAGDAMPGKTDTGAAIHFTMKKAA